MITEYIEAAMGKAKYEAVPDEHLYFGKIPGFRGLWASAPTKRECAKELRERLEGWILLSLRMNVKLPVVSGLSLNNNKALPAKDDLVHA